MLEPEICTKCCLFKYMEGWFYFKIHEGLSLNSAAFSAKVIEEHPNLPSASPEKKDKRLLQINQGSWVGLSHRYRNLVWISIINRFSKVDLNEFLLVQVEKNANTTGRSGGHCVHHISTLVFIEVVQLPSVD